MQPPPRMPTTTAALPKLRLRRGCRPLRVLALICCTHPATLTLRTHPPRVTSRLLLGQSRLLPLQGPFAIVVNPSHSPCTVVVVAAAAHPAASIVLRSLSIVFPAISTPGSLCLRQESNPDHVRMHSREAQTHRRTDMHTHTHSGHDIKDTITWHLLPRLFREKTLNRESRIENMM